jgi:hypothetical protein
MLQHPYPLLFYLESSLILPYARPICRKKATCDAMA